MEELVIDGAIIVKATQDKDLKTILQIECELEDNEIATLNHIRRISDEGGVQLAIVGEQDAEVDSRNQKSLSFDTQHPTPIRDSNKPYDDNGFAIEAPMLVIGKHNPEAEPGVVFAVSPHFEDGEEEGSLKAVEGQWDVSVLWADGEGGNYPHDALIVKVNDEGRHGIYSGDLIKLAASVMGAASDASDDLLAMFGTENAAEISTRLRDLGWGNDGILALEDALEAATGGGQPEVIHIPFSEDSKWTGAISIRQKDDAYHFSYWVAKHSGEPCHVGSLIATDRNEAIHDAINGMKEHIEQNAGSKAADKKNSTQALNDLANFQARLEVGVEDATATEKTVEPPSQAEALDLVLERDAELDGNQEARDAGNAEPDAAVNICETCKTDAATCPQAGPTDTCDSFVPESVSEPEAEPTAAAETSPEPAVEAETPFEGNVYVDSATQNEYMVKQNEQTKSYQVHMVRADGTTISLLRVNIPATTDPATCQENLDNWAPTQGFVLKGVVAEEPAAQVETTEAPTEEAESEFDPFGKE